MKRTNEFEKRCLTINSRLKKIPGDRMRKIIYRRVYGAGPIFRMYRGKKVFYCSECGGQIGVLTQKSCPHCHAKWTEKPQEYVKREASYYMELEAKGDIQLTRIYRVDRETHYGKKTDISVWEVVRVMYAPNGERKVFSRDINGMTYCWDSFSYWGDLIPRRENSHTSWGATMRFNLSVDTYHIKSLTKQWQYKDIPTLLKEYDNSTSALRVIAYPWGETLHKSGHQVALFNHLVKQRELLPKGTTHALNICTRNHYVVKDPSLWLDTLYLLKHYKMDTHNAHYVCPKDLRALHQILFKRKQREDEERAAIRRARELERWEQERIKRDKWFAEQKKKETEARKRYPEHMGKILSLDLVSTNLDIRPLQSVDEFKQEGDAMHHCVYAMKYWNYNEHPTSLILSAKDNEGHRLATIEYNMHSKEIVQCRAACNAVPERDKEIRGLINSHKADFERLLKAA